MTIPHPIDTVLIGELHLAACGLAFPPKGWEILKQWRCGWVLRHPGGLRAIIDCSMKDDDRWWCHVSVSRAKSMPTHDDMERVKSEFIGDRYAYSVFPPAREFVAIHHFCLHLWALIDGSEGRILPEFSGEFAGVKTILT